MAVEVIKIGMNVTGYALKLSGLIKDSTKVKINAKFDEVFDRIDNVDREIQDLHDELSREGLDFSYATPCERIRNGMTYLGFITDKHEVDLYKKKIKAICANDDMTSQLTALVNGIIGGVDLRGSILETMYKFTHGHLSKLEKFCKRLLALLVGGCAVLYYYETIQPGERKAKVFLEDIFAKKIESAEKSIADILKRCKTKVKENLEWDMKSYVDAHKDDKVKQKFVDEFYDEVKSKYGWLDLVVTSAERAPTVTGNGVAYFDSRHKKRLNVLYADKDRKKKFPNQTVIDKESDMVFWTKKVKRSAIDAIEHAMSPKKQTILNYMKYQGIPCLSSSEYTCHETVYWKTELTRKMGFFSCIQHDDASASMGAWGLLHDTSTKYTTFCILK